MRQITEFTRHGLDHKFWEDFDSIENSARWNVSQTKDLIFKALAHETEQTLARRIPGSSWELTRYSQERTEAISEAVKLLNEFCGQRDQLIASSGSFQKFKEAMRITKLYAHDVAKRYGCSESVAYTLQDCLKSDRQLITDKVQSIGTFLLSRPAIVEISLGQRLEDKFKRIARQLLSNGDLSESKRISDQERTTLENGRVKTKQEGVTLFNERLELCVQAFKEWSASPACKSYEDKKSAMYDALFGIRWCCTVDQLYSHKDLSKEAAARLRKMIV